MFYARKITITAAAFLGLLLFTTCKKDPYLSIGDGDCFDPEEGYVDPLAPRFDVLPEYYYKNYHMPCFNPNNPKEFCYLFAKQGVGGQLRKHNLQTGEDKLIYPISFSAPPKWNKNGKITFASGYQVYTIDEDGKKTLKTYYRCVYNIPCLAQRYYYYNFVIIVSIFLILSALLESTLTPTPLIILKWAWLLSMLQKMGKT